MFVKAHEKYIHQKSQTQVHYTLTKIIVLIIIIDVLKFMKKQLYHYWYHSLNRSFDFEIALKSGNVHTFSSIEKGEYDKLFDYISSKKLNVKNTGKNVSLIFFFILLYFISVTNKIKEQYFNFKIFYFVQNWFLSLSLHPFALTSQLERNLFTGQGSVWRRLWRFGHWEGARRVSGESEGGG